MPECPKCKNIEMELGTLLHGLGNFRMSSSALHIKIKRPAKNDPYDYVTYPLEAYRCPQCGHVELCTEPDK